MPRRPARSIARWQDRPCAWPARAGRDLARVRADRHRSATRSLSSRRVARGCRSSCDGSSVDRPARPGRANTPILHLALAVELVRGSLRVSGGAPTRTSAWQPELISAPPAIAEPANDELRVAAGRSARRSRLRRTSARSRRNEQVFDGGAHPAPAGHAATTAKAAPMRAAGEGCTHLLMHTM